jgi:hypothetical protein
MDESKLILSASSVEENREGLDEYYGVDKG